MSTGQIFGPCKRRFYDLFAPTLIYGKEVDFRPYLAGEKTPNEILKEAFPVFPFRNIVPSEGINYYGIDI